MFWLWRKGEEVCCNADYSVSVDKKCTVAEFVQQVLTRNEWGYVGIYCKKEPWGYGKPNCEYRGSQLLSTLPEDILRKRVVNATANGGWSRMDYLLWIK